MPRSGFILQLHMTLFHALGGLMITNNELETYPEIKALAKAFGAKDTYLFFDIVSYMLLHTGKIVTYSSITTFLRRRYHTLSPNTVKRYFDFLTNEKHGILTSIPRCYIKHLHKTTELNAPLVRGRSYYFNNEKVVNETITYLLNEGQFTFKDASLDKCAIMRSRHSLFKFLIDEGCTLTSGMFAYFSRRGRGYGVDQEDCTKPRQLICNIELVCSKTIDGIERKAYFAFPNHAQLERNSHEFEVFTHCLKNSSIDEYIYVVDFLSNSKPKILLSPNVKSCGLNWILNNIQSIFLDKDILN